MDSSGRTEPLVSTPGDYTYPAFSGDGERLALAVGAGKGAEIFVYDRERDALSGLTSSGG
jgi:Tol biopolymer transport system component